MEFNQAIHLAWNFSPILGRRINNSILRYLNELTSTRGKTEALFIHQKVMTKINDLIQEENREDFQGLLDFQ